MATDVFDHLAFCGCRVATDGRQLFGTIGIAFLDESRHIQVIRPEVIAPLRQTMRFVKDPSSDLPMANSLNKRPVAELLRRYKKNANVAKANFLQHVPPFGHGQQSIQSRSAVNTHLNQIVDLILHQRLQRRNDDRQAAVAPMTRQGGELVADRFAATGWQDSEEAFAGITGADDILLKRAATSILWLRTECRESKVAIKLS